jgi:putative oxidoreductase
MNAKKILTLLLGLIYFVFGLNFFLHFLPQPPMPDKAAAFAGAMFASGYFFQVLKTVEVASGLLLLAGLYVPLVLVILAPITLNIVLFHTFLAPQGMYLQVAIFVIHLVLGLKYYRSSYSALLKAKE